MIGHLLSPGGLGEFEGDLLVRQRKRNERDERLEQDIRIERLLARQAWSDQAADG